MVLLEPWVYPLYNEDNDSISHKSENQMRKPMFGAYMKSLGQWYLLPSQLFWF